MPLRVGHINIRGLYGSKHLLHDFITRHNIDILSINETITRASSKTPNFHGYTFLHQPRPPPHRGGGVGILIKTNIKFKILFSSSVPNEHITILVSTSSNLPLTISTIYCPDQLHRPCYQLFSSIINMCHRSLFLGDFNAKHSAFNNIIQNTNGKAHTYTHQVDCI